MERYVVTLSTDDEITVVATADCDRLAIVVAEYMINDDFYDGCGILITDTVSDTVVFERSA